MGLPRRSFIISGEVFTFIGVVLLITSYQGITGNAILGDVDYNLGSVIGIWFAVTGIVLLMGGRSRQESSLVGIAHEEAHNSARHARLVEHYRRSEDKTQMIRVSDEELDRYRNSYGLPPKSNEEDNWVTLYHATPRGKFAYSKDSFLDKNKIKGGGFYLGRDAVMAQEELPGLHPSDISILRIRIAKSVFDDIASSGVSPIGGRVYRISKGKVDEANKLFKAGYIEVKKGN